MKVNKALVGRGVFLGVSILALITLGVTVTVKANPKYKSMLDVNFKYTIKRVNENINDVVLYYPLFENMANKDVEKKINDKIINIKEEYSKVAKDGTLLSLDYDIPYKEDFISIVFKGNMIVNNKVLEACI